MKKEEDIQATIKRGKKKMLVNNIISLMCFKDKITIKDKNKLLALYEYGRSLALTCLIATFINMIYDWWS